MCKSKRNIGTQAYESLSCFDVKKENGIAHVTLNHPPLNLLDEDMASEFDTLTRQLESDDQVKVIILQSGLPDFFIAHSGLSRVTAGSTIVSATRSFRQTQLIGERIRNMPKVTIAKVRGRCRGGGNEIALASDMCFAALDNAIFGQPEVGLGLVPGGGSTQRLPRAIGRAKALEVLLSCRDFSAAEAERMGFINRALPEEELDAYVDDLASDLAHLPSHAVAHIKRAVDEGVFSSVSEGLLVEAQCADECVATEATRNRVKQGLAKGLETVEGESELTSIIHRLD